MPGDSWFEDSFSDGMLEELSISDRIGRGSYGVVYRGAVRDTERAVEIDVAVKVVPMDASDGGAAQHEVALHRESSQHSSIVKLFGSFHFQGSQ